MNIQCLVYDIETYPNYFMIGYSVCKPELDDKGNVTKFSYTRYYVDSDDMNKMKSFLERVFELKDRIVMIGYNNTFYDKVMLEKAYSIRFKKKEEFLEILYDLSNRVVSGKESIFKYNSIPQYDLLVLGHSLKSVGALIHQDYIIELPYEPSTILTEEQKKEIVKYNQDNDLDITEKLLNLKLDSFLTQYEVIMEFDLPMSSFSYSSSGLAELVLQDTNRVVTKQLRCTYKCPYDFEFEDETLKSIKYEMENTTFVISNDESSFKRTFVYNGLEIVVGEGGIHACIPNYVGSNVIDVDATSYYPSLIINLDTLPTDDYHKQLFCRIKEERVIDKKAGRKGKANAKKLIINSAFGKTKFFSRKDNGEIKRLGQMFDFKAFMTTTLTGQLLLMKLMEDLTKIGCKVVYMNTDGLSFENLPQNDNWRSVIKDWETLTGISMEDVVIEKSYVKDVNNYIMIVNEGGKIKRKIKGAYVTDCDGTTSNSAKRRICFDAVTKYVLDGVDIEETIRNSTDIRDFVIHNKFSSKFSQGYIQDKDGKINWVGRVPRWYKSTKNKNQLMANSSSRGNQLRPFASDNITIINKLSDFNDKLPDDLDIQWYVNEAYKIYKDLTGSDIMGNNKVNTMLDELRERGIIF